MDIQTTYLSAAGVIVLMAAVKSVNFSSAFSIFSCRGYVDNFRQFDSELNIIKSKVSLL